METEEGIGKNMEKIRINVEGNSRTKTEKMRKRKENMEKLEKI